MSDDEYQRLLKQFPERVNNYINWKKYFERLVQAGRRTGRSDIEIGDDIRNEMRDQLDERTIRAYLPQSMKHMEKRKLSLELKPKYEDLNPHPPPPRIVEIQPESEPAKTVEKPINTPREQVFLVGKCGFPYDYDKTFSSRMDNVFVIITRDNKIETIESIGRKLARKMYPDIPIKD